MTDRRSAAERSDANAVAFAGFLGTLIILAVVPLLFWNEVTAIRAGKSLEEGAGSVVAVTKPEPAHEGKLVYVTGQAVTDEALADDLGASAVALRMERSVEMYQWRRDTGRRSNPGAPIYDEVWSHLVLPSEAGHANPAAMKPPSLDRASTRVKLGEFEIPAAVVGAHFDEWGPLEVGFRPTDAAVSRLGAKRDGQYWYVGANPAAPAIGDCRFVYRIVATPLTMSIVAKQEGGALVPYKTQAGDLVLLTAMKIKDPQAMFTKAEEHSTNMTFVYRGLLYSFLGLGIFLLLLPFAKTPRLAAFATSIPTLGGFAFAWFAAAGLSSLAIAPLWLSYRPGTGLFFFGGAAAAIVVAVLLARLGRKPNVAQAA